MTTVRLIRGSVSPDDAAGVARRASGAPEAAVERELFYPYHYFLLRVSWRTLLGRDGGKIPCLVDARTRIVSTADPVAFDDVLVDAPSALPPRVSEPDAERLARRAAALAAGRRRRALSAPSWELLDRGLLHKRFWLVAVGAGRVVVDGVTAGFYPV